MAEREPAPGDLLGGRYEILSELGRGGMATVYRGLDTLLQRRVAVKVFRNGFAEAVDPQRTTQEMRLLASVNHPSVVAVLDASTGDRLFGAYLVMELVVGDDLGALVHRARGPLSADFARRIVADVASALTALHELGVVHRDVKPANILVPTAASSPTTAVAAKLTDFGIAQLVDGSRITAPASILGTAAYLSPEQVRGAAPRPESDVYSLGLVLLETLTGERAFPGPATEAAMARLHRPPTLPTNASPALADLLSRMTALEPSHRPSAATVTSALREQLVGRVTAPDAVQTAPTPVAGFAALRARHPRSESTQPQEPFFTPSRGMPIGAPLPKPAEPRRRFPTLLAVAASVLAIALAGVAISAAAGLNTKEPQANADVVAPASVAPPAPAAQGGASNAPAGFDLAQHKHSAAAAATPKPTPTRTSATPTPTPTAPTPTPTPTDSAPSTPTPAPTTPVPQSTPSESAAPSSTPSTPTDDGSVAPTDPSIPTVDDSTV